MASKVKRMFSSIITKQDDFLDMPLSAQALYFHINMEADDEGFVSNVKSLRRQVRSSEDDLKILVAKRYLLTFESGVVVIKHWLIHNTIRQDRVIETTYKEEKRQLSIKENMSYTENIGGVGHLTDICQTLDGHMTDTCRTLDGHLTDNCQPNLTNLYLSNNIYNKDNIKDNKNIKDKDIKDKDSLLFDNSISKSNIYINKKEEIETKELKENTTKEKQENKEQQEKVIISDVVGYLNYKCHTKYRINNTRTQSYIRSRLNEGFKLEDFKKVIDVKHKEWFGTEMSKYLNPETLFRPSNFEKYVNQAQVEGDNRWNKIDMEGF